MQRTFIILTLLPAFLLFSVGISGQCTPGDETTCPDPEENGEICPDSIPDGAIMQTYSQVITILPPPKIVLDSAAGTFIDLHHIELIDVDNLPPGLTWESNAENNVFLVGSYYCARIDGNPTETGVFPLKIIVDVYIPGVLGSPPIKVATATDSTSLSITITETAGVADPESASFNITGCSPNPFRNTFDLTFFTAEPDIFSYELFDLMGKKVLRQNYPAIPGLNKIRFDGSHLANGLYLYSIGNARHYKNGRILKTN
jgi:hypothetical protein